MKQEYLSAGKVINIHGFRGTVKLESYCDTPKVLADLPAVYLFEKGEYIRKKNLHASVFRQFVLMDLEGVTDEMTANSLRGREIFALRGDIPLSEGAVFFADLIDLPVKHIDTGEELGRIIRVETRTGRDFYVVQNQHGEFYLPAVREFIIRTDPDDAVFVRPIPGLLDDGGEQV